MRLNIYFYFFKILFIGQPGWLSGLVSAFGSGHDPRVLGLSPASSSPGESTSPPAYVSASLSLCLS